MAGRELSHRNEGRSTISPARAWFPERLTAAAAVGLLAFACYWHTLLPGLDFGDTAAFQTGVGSLSLTPRQAYPLYYGLGNIVAWLDPQYRTVIVARNKRDYVWIMARTPAIPEAQYELLVSRVVALGYDASKLRKVPQQWGSAAPASP